MNDEILLANLRAGKSVAAPCRQKRYSRPSCSEQKRTVFWERRNKRLLRPQASALSHTGASGGFVVGKHLNQNCASRRRGMRNGNLHTKIEPKCGESRIATKLIYEV